MDDANHDDSCTDKAAPKPDAEAPKAEPLSSGDGLQKLKAQASEGYDKLGKFASGSYQTLESLATEGYDKLESIATEGYDKLESIATEGYDKLEQAAMGFATDSSPRLERLGLDYFERRSKRRGVSLNHDEVHILNDEENRQLRRIEHGVIARGALIGAGSGAASALASLFIIGDAETSTLGQDLAVIGVTILATIIEIVLLYADALRSVHELAIVSGIDLGGIRDAPEGSDRRAIATALARTALELPTPPNNPFGINPHRKVSAWRLFFVTVLYKLKITVTNFLLKMVLRRLGGRVGLREWLYFVDVPVTALWDGVVAWWVIRNARICAMGPSASNVAVARIAETHPDMPKASRHMLLRAAAVTVVRRTSLHPNLVAMLRELERFCGQVSEVSGAPIDDDAFFLEALVNLSPSELEAVLEVVAVSVVIDGAVGRGDRQLLREICDQLGYRYRSSDIKNLLGDFLSGRPLTSERLRQAVSRPEEARGN